jgi:hypothetical protein
VFSGIIEKVSCANVFVLVVVYDRGFQEVKREEVEDLMGGRIL